MLKCCDVSVVDVLCLFITCILGLRLFKEACELLLGIILFCVSVAKFLPVDEELEALSHSRLASVPLRKRTHHLRMVNDEGRVEDRVLQK